MASQPDYDFWLKLDHWTLKDAALLVSGFEPEEFRSVRFTTKQICNPPENPQQK